MDEKTTLLRCNQIFKNFFRKAIRVVLLSKIPSHDISSLPDIELEQYDKWFNINLPVLKSIETLPPLQPNVLENAGLHKFESAGLNVEVSLNSFELGRSRLYRSFQDSEVSQCISNSQPLLLERWRFSFIAAHSFSAQDGSETANKLPHLYKRLIVLFRSLYTYSNWVPSAGAQQWLAEVRPLLRCQISTLQPIDSSTGSVVMDFEHESLKYRFSDVESVFGSFAIEVAYTKPAYYTIRGGDESAHIFKECFRPGYFSSINEEMDLRKPSGIMPKTFDFEDTSMSLHPKVETFTRLQEFVQRQSEESQPEKSWRRASSVVPLHRSYQEDNEAQSETRSEAPGDRRASMSIATQTIQRAQEDQLTDNLARRYSYSYLRRWNVDEQGDNPNEQEEVIRRGRHLFDTQKVPKRHPRASSVASSRNSSLRGNDKFETDYQKSRPRRASRGSSASYHIERTDAHFPPMPKKTVADDETNQYEYKCDLCDQKIMITRRRDWQRHVLNDIEPYVCLERTCNGSNVTHFASVGRFTAHYKSKHPEATLFQSSNLLCMFCERALPETYDEKVKHVAHHLEEVAFSALPQLREAWTFYSESSDYENNSEEDKNIARFIKLLERQKDVFSRPEEGDDPDTPYPTVVGWRESNCYSVYKNSILKFESSTMQ